MRKPFSRTVVASHVEIGYLEYGNPDGLPVFLLHGFPDSPACWAEVVKRLDTKRLRLIAPFVRGYGGSTVRAEDHLSGQVAAFASDLLTLADRLGIQRFHLVGHDWGARTAYAVAALAPHRVAGAVALATPYVMSRGETESPEQAQAYWYQWYFGTEHGAKVFASDPVGFAQALWRAWSPTWRFSAKEFSQAAKSFDNPQFVPIVLHSYRQRWKGAPSVAPYDLTQSILDARPKIEVPTIFAYGQADACNLPSSSAGQENWFSGAFRSVGFRGVGHFPQREAPKAVARLIAEMLRETA